MPTQVGTVFPVAEEWLGIGREAATAIAVAPSATFAIEKVEPDEHYQFLDDVSLRGMMANLFSVTGGTQYAEVDFSGNVYLDTIGHVLLNLMGDYGVTGTAGTGSTTTSAAAVAGATTLSVAAITGFSSGQAVQVGTGASAQVVVLSAAPSGTTLTFTGTPLRLPVASGATVQGVVAPFTHVFSLLNSSPGQPPTHTLTHFQGLTAPSGSAQYAYWCCSGCSFNMDAEKLFTHQTKGMSYIQQPSALAAPAAPATTTAGTGGTVAAGTYAVTVTYVNSAGETVASANGPVTTAGTTSTITVPSPAALGNATGWYAYVSQAGGTAASGTRQQAAGSPTAIGTALTLTAPPTTTGVTSPAANTSGNYTNAFSNVPVYANWQFAIGIGGPASGATLVPSVAMAGIDITRDLKNYFTASGQQAPYAIGRNALHVEGKFTHVAQNQSPMLNLLNNTQPQIQLKATNGLTGASLLAITFDMQVGAYETVKLQNNEVIEYEVMFRAVANPTNAGNSGGQSPLKVTIQNAVPTY